MCWFRPPTAPEAAAAAAEKTDIRDRREDGDLALHFRGSREKSKDMENND